MLLILFISLKIHEKALESFSLRLDHSRGFFHEQSSQKISLHQPRQTRSIFSLRFKMGFARVCLLVLAGAQNQRPSCFRRLGLRFLCAPARTRTWNDGSEDRSDIHFTTGAFRYLLTQIGFTRNI